MVSVVCVYFSAPKLNYQVFYMHFKNVRMASGGDS